MNKLSIMKAVALLIACFFIGIGMGFLMLTIARADEPVPWEPHQAWRAEPDGSTVWTSDMHIDAPGVWTGDYLVHNWKGRGDPEQDELVNMIFMFGMGIAVNSVYEQGKTPDWGYSVTWFQFNGSITKDFIEELRIKQPGNPLVWCIDKIDAIAEILWKELKVEFFSIGYYPQWDAFIIYLHPTNMKYFEDNYRIAHFLNNHQEWSSR